MHCSWLFVLNVLRLVTSFPGTEKYIFGEVKELNCIRLLPGCCLSASYIKKGNLSRYLIRLLIYYIIFIFLVSYLIAWQLLWLSFPTNFSAVHSRLDRDHSSNSSCQRSCPLRLIVFSFSIPSSLVGLFWSSSFLFRFSFSDHIFFCGEHCNAKHPEGSTDVWWC